MACGGTDRAVRVDMHDVQIAERKNLFEGAEFIVHQLQQLIRHRHHIRQILMIIPAPGGHALIRHGDKVHVLHLQSVQDCLLRKPQNVLEGEVRGNVLLEHLGKLADFGHVLDLKHLLQHSLQKSLLGLDPPDVAVAVSIGAVPEPDDPHGLLTVELLVSLLDMDGEILIGVLIIHVPGNVEVHAAHGVHDLAHGFPFHDHLVIRLEAHQLGDLLIQGLDPLVSAAVHVVDGVDLLHVPVDVDHGIPGNGHNSGLLVGHVIRGQEHGVRISAAAGIPAQNQDRVKVFALTLATTAGTHTVSIVQLFFLRLRLLRLQIRLDKQALAGHHHGQHQCQQHRHHDQDLLLPCQTAGFFRFFLPGLFRVPARHMLSSLSIHVLFYPFSASRASIVAWCTGFPISVISSMDISRPNSRPAFKSS